MLNIYCKATQCLPSPDTGHKEAEKTALPDAHSLEEKHK